nr:hypothetical protein [Paracoccus aminovorans]
MTQHEGRDELALVTLILRSAFPGPDQIAHRFVRLVGDPDWGQLSGAQNMRKPQGIKSIGRDSLPSPDRDQGWRDDAAVATGRAYLPVKAVARRARLVAGRDIATTDKLLQQLVDGGRGILERAQTQRLIPTLLTCDRDRKLVLGHINSDVDPSMGVPHVFLHRKRRHPPSRDQNTG